MTTLRDDTIWVAIMFGVPIALMLLIFFYRDNSGQPRSCAEEQLGELRWRERV